MAMTLLYQQCKQQRWLLLFLSFPCHEWLFLLPPLSMLNCVVVAVDVVVVMFKSLHLAEIYTPDERLLV